MATQSNRAMISETHICNMALSWLGAQSISSLEEDSTEAEYCRNNYPFARDAALEEHAWTFATVREASTTADLDTFETAYRHSVPLDWLKVLRVYCTVTGANPDNWVQADGWRREGRFILANDATIYMWGIKRIVDTGYFSSLFSKALAARLAAEICTGITENPQLEQMMWAKYKAFLADAAASDGAQGRNEKIQSNSLVNARRSGGLLYE